MFMGEYNHSLDAKGRIIIPAKFRESLGEEFVITRGLDGCLFLYPKNEWDDFLDKLKTLPGSRESRHLKRYFLALATDCEMDKQGRVLIPLLLREKAELEKEVVFVGVLNKIEIWSKDKWVENNNYDNVDDIAEDMSKYGISF